MQVAERNFLKCPSVRYAVELPHDQRHACPAPYTRAIRHQANDVSLVLWSIFGYTQALDTSMRGHARTKHGTFILRSDHASSQGVSR